MKKLLVVLGLAMSVFSLQANAAFQNIGFETGDFSGWTLTGTGSVKTTLDDPTHPEGNYFASITGSSSLTQIATFNVGDKIEFMWKFVANDYLPFDDYAFFVGDKTYNLLSSVSVVGNYGQTGWNLFSHIVTETSTGPVVFGVVNLLDTIGSSELRIDATPSAVPVPAAVWLFGSALMGLTGFSRRKKA
jgi:hypothetical protein